MYSAVQIKFFHEMSNSERVTCHGNFTLTVQSFGCLHTHLRASIPLVLVVTHFFRWFMDLRFFTSFGSFGHLHASDFVYYFTTSSTSMPTCFRQMPAHFKHFRPGACIACISDLRNLHFCTGLPRFQGLRASFFESKTRRHAPRWSWLSDESAESGNGR